jgi:hypothetical protein
MSSALSHTPISLRDRKWPAPFPHRRRATGAADGLDCRQRASQLTYDVDLKLSATFCSISATFV